MDIKNFKKEYIFEAKIELDDSGNYVVLREPTTLELKEFGDDEKANIELLIKIFPDCIVEHTFENGDKKATNKEVHDLLIASGHRYTDIIATWMDAIPFKKKTKETSDKQPK